MLGIKIRGQIVGSFLIVMSSSVFAEINIDQLNTQTQNPIANLFSIPLENNITFGVGTNRAPLYILNVQPIYPIKLTENWNIITRTVIPIKNQPNLGGKFTSRFGLGDTTFTPFLSPAKPGFIIWGFGPAFLLPTAGTYVLGFGKWGIGPSLVVLVQPGHWTAGLLTNQIWSLAGNNKRPLQSQTLIQPFAAYTFACGWSTSFVSETTYNWKAKANNNWLVPLDFIVSKITLLGKQPLSVGGGVRYFPVKPHQYGSWGVRFTVSFLFPE